MKPHRPLAIAGALAASILCLSAFTTPQDEGARDENEADVAVGALEAWRWDVTRERWVHDDASSWSVGVEDAVGELHGYQRMNLASGATPIRLRMTDGRARLVDLGPGLTPAAFGIRPGERVWVQGDEAVVDGLRVLFASRIAVERAVTPERSAETSAARRGTVESVERIDSAEGVEHVLVRVSVPDGETHLYCLGAAREDAVPQHGTEIVLRDAGRAVDERPRTVAAVQGAGDVSVRSASYAFTERARSARAAAEEPVVEEIAGRIESAWRLPLGDTGTGRALVKLALGNGIDAIVDFGSERMVDRVDLDDGEVVWIAGVREQVSGVPVLRAREVRIDGALYVVSAGGE